MTTTQGSMDMGMDGDGAATRVTEAPRDFLLRRPALATIAEQVAVKHGVTLAELLCRRRFKALAYARQEAMWRCRYETLESLPTIGRALNRTHWTVMHGIEAHERRINGGMNVDV